MFSGLFLNTWIVATVVAVVAGATGFFAVMRGAAFASHALPQGAFAGAAGAALIGASTLLGFGVFAGAGALLIAWLGRRGRHDVVTALAFVLMLGLGALFLSMSTEYAPEIYSLLFGEILGISRSQILPTLLLALVSLGAIAVVYRPLLFSSVLPEIGEARGIRPYRMEIAFLLIIAITTTTTVPVVGALLMFSLMIAPAAAARSFTPSPWRALSLSVAIAVVTIWMAIVASYESNWPIGFFVGVFGAGSFVIARTWAAWQRRQVTKTQEVVVAGAG